MMFRNPPTGFVGALVSHLAAFYVFAVMALLIAPFDASAQVRPSDEADEEPRTIVFSQHLSRPSDGKSFEELAPRNFSFNSPYGACSHCDGLGTVFDSGDAPDLGFIFEPEILGSLIGLAVLSLIPVIYKRYKVTKG